MPNMYNVKTAQILAEANGKLRELVKEMLDQQLYEDAKRVTDLASKLAMLADTVADSTKRNKEETSVLSYGIRKNPDGGKSYPQFVLDEDYLIKTGWSKRRSGEYVHRVSMEVVQAYVGQLIDNFEELKTFTIEDLATVYDKFGNEVPSYQIYVVFAWLRQEGIIEKKGRNSYSVRNRSSLISKVRL